MIKKIFHRLNVGGQLIIPTVIGIIIIIFIYSALLLFFSENQKNEQLKRATTAFQLEQQAAEAAFKQRSENNLAVISQITEQIVQDSYLRFDYTKLEELSRNLARLEDIVYVDFLDNSNQSLLLENFDKANVSEKITLPVTIGDGKDVLGFIELGLTNQALNILEDEFKALVATLVETEQQQIQKARNLLLIIAVVALVIAIISITFILQQIIQRIVVNPLKEVQQAVTLMYQDNDFSKKITVKGDNEIAQLTSEFNKAISYLEQENIKLNESLVSVLIAADKLAQGDLTISLQVSEDIIGPLADAINMMTEKTSLTLKNVNKVSQAVAQSAQEAQNKNIVVANAANREQKILALTLQELENEIKLIQKMEKLVQVANQDTTTVANTTFNAKQAVLATEENMQAIRDAIRETEKRLKRLGERSQEISEILDIIDSIADRTQLLAINASMQAAAAGEAGAGFSVVADEVQQLAENAQQATAQIANLIKNINVETADTMITMNQTITQVVNGSQLSAQASAEMEKSQSVTEALVQAVQQISDQMKTQYNLSQQLQQRAKQSQQTSQATRQAMELQNQEINQLLDAAKQLVTALQVFKLAA